MADNEGKYVNTGVAASNVLMIRENCHDPEEEDGSLDQSLHGEEEDGSGPQDVPPCCRRGAQGHRDQQGGGGGRGGGARPPLPGVPGVPGQCEQWEARTGEETAELLVQVSDGGAGETEVRPAVLQTTRQSPGVP